MNKVFLFELIRPLVAVAVLVVVLVLEIPLSFARVLLIALPVDSSLMAVVGVTLRQHRARVLLQLEGVILERILTHLMGLDGASLRRVAEGLAAEELNRASKVAAHVTRFLQE